MGKNYNVWSWNTWLEILALILLSTMILEKPPTFHHIFLKQKLWFWHHSVAPDTNIAVPGTKEIYSFLPALPCDLSPESLLASECLLSEGFRDFPRKSLDSIAWLSPKLQTQLRVEYDSSTLRMVSGWNIIGVQWARAKWEWPLTTAWRRRQRCLFFSWRPRKCIRLPWFDFQQQKGWLFLLWMHAASSVLVW